MIHDTTPASDLQRKFEHVLKLGRCRAQTALKSELVFTRDFKFKRERKEKIAVETARKVASKIVCVNGASLNRV